MSRGITRTNPPWLPRAIAAGAILCGVVSIAVEYDEMRPPLGPAEGLTVSVGLILFLVSLWLVETLVVSLPNPLLFGAVALPVMWFVFVGRSSASPCFLIFLVVWVTFTGTRRESTAALVVAWLALLLPLPVAEGEVVDWVGWFVGVGFAWLSSRAVRTQQGLLDELQLAQADLARRSALEERQRIARELHDVIAHSLAITMLHLTGARHILSRGRPEDTQRAAEALAQAEQLGRQSLSDIRRTVGLLGAGGDGRGRETGTAPLPGAADIPALVADYQRAGLAVELTVGGEPGRVPTPLGLELYRITQEALANVAKHAPGARVSVVLTITSDRVSLRVVDDGGVRPRVGESAVAANGGSGLGLAGMRERATRQGGMLTAGPTERGWLVECSIPIDPMIQAIPKESRGTA